MVNRYSNFILIRVNIDFFYKYYRTPIVIIVLGVWFRFFAMSMGNMEDYNIFNEGSSLFRNSRNIYLEAPNFDWPYSSLFIQTLSWMQFLTQFSSNLSFRFSYVTLLTLIDVGIFILIKNNFGYNRAVFYFLSPISIIITGYHNQFDNLALLMGFAGVLLLNNIDERNKHSVSSIILVSSLLIGLSINLKHIFIFLPLYILFSKIDFFIKVRVFFLSYFVVFIYMGINFFTTPSAFINQVLNYSSWANYPLLYWLNIPNFSNFQFAKDLLILVMIFGAFFSYKFNPLYIVPYYLLILFTFTPAIANQQWVIALLIATIFPNILFSVWAIVTSLALLADEQELRLSFFRKLLPEYLIRNPAANLDGYFNGVFRNLYLLYLAGFILLLYKILRKNSFYQK